jgi:hypothetical protein
LTIGWPHRWTALSVATTATARSPGAAAWRTRRTKFIHRQLTIAILVELAQGSRRIINLSGIDHTIVIGVQCGHHRRRWWALTATLLAPLGSTLLGATHILTLPLSGTHALTLSAALWLTIILRHEIGRGACESQHGNQNFDF